MNQDHETRLLRIYASSTDTLNGQPFYQAVVIMAKDHGLSGATVLKGIMGYGASSKIHSVRLWEITEKLPVVIEIIDNADKIDDFMVNLKPKLNQMPKGCLVTQEKINVSFYKSGK